MERKSSDEYTRQDNEVIMCNEERTTDEGNKGKMEKNKNNGRQIGKPGRQIGKPT